MRLPALVGVALLVITTAGCGSTEPSPAPSDRIESYVALGDDFAAAPGVPVTDEAVGCERSKANYPSLLADELGATRFADVTCSDAESLAVTRSQLTSSRQQVPAQYDAVTPDTDLVTLTVGINDNDLFEDMTHSCMTLDGFKATGCKAFLAKSTKDWQAAVAKNVIAVESALYQIQEHSPNARVVLVGYPRIAPKNGSCHALLPTRPRALRVMDTIMAALNDAMRGAAERRHVGYVDVYAASAGHDVCSDHPWVNGSEPTSRAEALSPLAAGQKAVAAMILKQVK